MSICHFDRILLASSQHFVVEFNKFLFFALAYFFISKIGVKSEATIFKVNFLS
jgi:hypothetical protein